MDRRGYIARLGGAVAAGLAGCTARSEDDDYDIGMSAAAFLPDRITVDAGGTVVWENTGSRSHTVTAYEATLPDGATYFASGGFETQRAAVDAWSEGMGGAIRRGERFEHTFEIPGEYPYYCIPHERGGMVGTVVVTGDR